MVKNMEHLCLVVFSVLAISLQHTFCETLTQDGSTACSLVLDGDDWTVINSNKTISIPATVPGSIYTDLLRNGIIGDPYYRFNDVTSRWVSYDSWTYTKHFKVSRSLLNHKVVQLVADGVDTVASIYINNHKVADTNNMFRRYMFDVKTVLQEGPNVIQIVFTSPVKYAKQQSSAYPYPVPPQCPPPAQRGECHGNFIRKEACSFSWDWGPAFPTMGIWKRLAFQVHDKVIIRDVTTETHRLDSGEWFIAASVFYDVLDTKVKIFATLTLTLPELNVTQKETTYLVDGVARMKVRLPKSADVSLWWPSGHGESKLYDLILTSNTEHTQEEKRIRIGFREIQLVQEPIKGSTGLSFYFKINGKPIFMKGSNWIPADAFQERLTAEYVRDLLTSARDANMNALRVWGGGIYESDTFYNIADELGIMIWQDMMFACAMYPSDEEFLENVREETTYQVRRLKSHPSIILWSGNNENEIGLAYYRKQAAYKLYYRDYIKLYRDTISTVIAREDTTRPFVPSSPSNGAETLREGWVAQNPQDNRYGDIHHYDYTSDSWDWRVFPVPRFASEYGLQSWCSLETLQDASVPSDRTATSQFVKYRQHHPLGNNQLLDEIKMHFNYSEIENTTSPQDNFEKFVYLSQVNQGVGIKTETELYRRSQSDVVNGYGMTMGALYWQLNDIWQGPTWASLEYGGKWKILHYFAKKFFATEMLSPFLDGANVRVFLVNETIEQSFSNLGHPKPNRTSPLTLKYLGQGQNAHEGPAIMMLYVTCYMWASLKPLKVWKPKVISSEIYREDLGTILAQSGCPSRKDCFLYFSLSPDGSVGPTNWLLLSYFTTAQGLQKPQIKVSDLMKTGDRMFSFTLNTDHIAPFVWMEMTGVKGHFHDNGFIMVDSHMSMSFTSQEPINIDIAKSLKVHSLTSWT